MKILVTGSAGFIGFHTVLSLLARGESVVGLDSLNEYYDVSLKEGRLRECGIDPQAAEWGRAVRSRRFENYTFLRLDLSHRESLAGLLEREEIRAVIHLAAQAGVRYSLENPYAYIDSNISGTLNLLEECRRASVNHLVFASSSSVYGLNGRQPWSVRDETDHPVSLYAATKKSCELMVHSYSLLYGIPSTGLRFFTVYGPWGRPDMALFLFTKSILEGSPIDVYNEGNMKRDFTYVDDVVEGIVRVLSRPPAPDPQWNPLAPSPESSSAPYRLYNIGSSSPVGLLAFIEALEDVLGKKARKRFLPLQKGDVLSTWADVSGLERDFGYRPATSIKEGLQRFVDWYRAFYGM